MFIYTGDSPINSTGLGLNNLCSKICGERKKRQVDEEENRGANTEYDDDDLVRPAEERRRTEGSQGGSRKQWITNKDTGYDMPQDGDPESTAGFNGSNNELQNKTSRNNNYGNTQKSIASDGNNYGIKQQSFPDGDSTLDGMTDIDIEGEQ